MGPRIVHKSASPINRVPHTPETEFWEESGHISTRPAHYDIFISIVSAWEIYIETGETAIFNQPSGPFFRCLETAVGNVLVFKQDPGVLLV